jgi:hypothetical protein
MDYISDHFRWLFTVFFVSILVLDHIFVKSNSENIYSNVLPWMTMILLVLWFKQTNNSLFSLSHLKEFKKFQIYILIVRKLFRCDLNIKHVNIVWSFNTPDDTVIRLYRVWSKYSVLVTHACWFGTKTFSNNICCR